MDFLAEKQYFERMLELMKSRQNQRHFSRVHTDLENLKIDIKLWKTWKTHGKVFFSKKLMEKSWNFFCHTSKQGVSIIIGSPWTLHG